MTQTMHSRMKTYCLAGGALAAALLALIMLAPPFTTWRSEHTSMLTVHLLLELFAIIIASLIAVLSWHAFSADDDVRFGNVMLIGFMVVAVCDLVHALTYDGMPAFLAPASTPRAIFFWLMGRTAEVLTLAAVALGVGLRAPRLGALGAGAALSALLVAVGSYRVDLLPVTFVPGEGVTAFKAHYEYALSAANMAVAWVMWRRAGRLGEARYYLLAMSCLVMGLGELAFTRYRSPNDFQNIFGHVYKVVGYGLLYLAVFNSSIRAPFDALRDSERRVRESELRLRSLSSNLPNCVVYQVVRERDGAMNFVHVSDSVERLNGVKAADVLRDAQTLYRQVHPDDVATLRAAQEASGRQMSVFDVVLRVRRPDGELRWMHLYSAPRPLDDGRIVWDGVQFDVTDERVAEDARRSLELRLRETQKMEAIGTLAGGIAHDFNNVLGSLLGNLALARDDIRKGETALALQSLDQVNRAGLRARELVRQILTFSRRQTQELRRQPLQPLVEESIALLRATLPAGVSLDVQLAPTSLHVMADATQVEQVVMNLCTNAWQALHGQAGRITVRLDAVPLDARAGREAGGLPAGDYLRLRVCDEGAGIAPEALEHIFEPFYTTKQAGEGTGLGLSVVHGIVRAHHGGIAVHSQPGQGSTFDVFFPAVQPGPERAREAGTPPPPAPGQGQLVVYVDDDELMELMVARLLERAGYRVLAFRHPRQALAALVVHGPAVELLVTDFNMPEMSGLELASEARRLHPGLPVLMSSGYVSDELLVQARRVGVHAVLQKQNTLEELSALVRETLQKTRSAV
ncbi:MAG: response regulator [Rhizobacter sp.]|nr:response regulator [Rhizobacter sp.]